MEAAQLLSKQGIEVSVIRLLTVSPLPEAALLAELSGYRHAVILEESMENSGVHFAVSEMIMRNISDIRVDALHLGENFVTHGSVAELYRQLGVDGASVAEYIRRIHQNEN